jgi:hypothetical protein
MVFVFDLNDSVNDTPLTSFELEGEALFLRPLTGKTFRFMATTNMYSTKAYNTLSTNILDRDNHGGSDVSYNAADF